MESPAGKAALRPVGATPVASNVPDGGGVFTPPARAASDPWRDAEDTPIALHSRVEQITVDTEHGALPSRLHQRGQVIGRGTGGLVYVRFEHENQLIALRPHLLRVLDTPDGC